MKRKPLRAALSIGRENRFGLLGAEHVGKMVRDSNLEEFGLDAGMLCARLADMAKLIPKALAKVLAEVRSCGTSDKDAVAEAMQREIRRIANACLHECEKDASDKISRAMASMPGN